MRRQLITKDFWRHLIDFPACTAFNEVRNADFANNVRPNARGGHRDPSRSAPAFEQRALASLISKDSYIRNFSLVGLQEVDSPRLGR